MQKMFGLLLIIVLIWFGLSAYTGDGRGGIDLGSWLDPIGGERDAEGEKLGFSEPKLASDVDDDDTGLSAQRRTRSQSRQNIGRPIRAKGETLPQSMKRRVSDAYQKSYDRVER